MLRKGKLEEVIGSDEDSDDSSESDGSTDASEARATRWSVKGIALVAVALLFAYFGFAGGEQLADWLGASPETLAPVLDHRSHELADEEGGEEEDQVDALQLLQKYYSKHNPKMIADVPMILNRYAGRETELFSKLEKKYGQPVVPSLRQKDSDEDGEEPEDPGEDEQVEKEEQVERKPQKQHIEVEEEEVEEEREGDNEGEDDEDEEEMVAQPDGSGEDGTISADSLPDHAFDVSEESSLDSLSATQDNSRGQVRVIVLGFPGTGVEETASFLQQGLGLTVAGGDDVCAAVVQLLTQSGTPEFNRFDQFDSIADDSISIFYEQVLATYPSTKVLITVREVDDWYSSFSSFVHRSQSSPSFMMRFPLYRQLLGTMEPSAEFLWKKMYSLFYDRLFATVSRTRRVLIPVFSDPGRGSDKTLMWKWVANFLGENIRPEWEPPQLEGSLHPVPGKVVDALSKLHMGDDTRLSGKGFLKVMVVGLPGSGTHAVASALKKLGFSVVDVTGTCTTSDCKRVTSKLKEIFSGTTRNPNFGFGGVFHGVDAVVGAPADLFVQETLKSNPDLKVIALVRNLDVWWRYCKCVFRKEESSTSRRSHDDGFTRQLLFGSEERPSEYVAKKRYVEHLDLVRKIPKERLVLLDVERSASDAWRQLCDLVRVSKCSSRLSATHFPAIESCS